MHLVRMGALALATFFATGCAPRHTQATHFERWDQAAAKRKAEEAKVEAKQAQGARPAAGSGAAKPAASTKPSEAPPPDDYSSLPSGQTPPVRTSTPAPKRQSPPEDDRDVVY